MVQRIGLDKPATEVERKGFEQALKEKGIVDKNNDGFITGDEVDRSVRGGFAAVARAAGADGVLQPGELAGVRVQPSKKRQSPTGIKLTSSAYSIAPQQVSERAFTGPAASAVSFGALTGTQNLQVKGKDVIGGDGKPISLSWNLSTLSFALPDGTKKVLKGSAEEVVALKEQFQGAKPAVSWTASETLKPAGSVGPFASVLSHLNRPIGGEHNQVWSGFETYNMGTADRVSLEAILSKAEIAAIERGVINGLKAAYKKAVAENEAEAKAKFIDPATLDLLGIREAVNTSYALHSDGGRSYVRIGVAYDVYANESQRGGMSVFTFDITNSPRFKAALEGRPLAQAPRDGVPYSYDQQEMMMIAGQNLAIYRETVGGTTIYKAAIPESCDPGVQVYDLGTEGKPVFKIGGNGPSFPTLKAAFEHAFSNGS